ncbi:MAG: M56 family metallopeptidase, partial [Chitinophagaceae bacterium]|nr:M56 family metallopeptidase [Chitinophagaceae bacterium]
MIYQIAPMVTTAILQSLLVAGICYATFRLLLAPMKHIDPLLKYHAGNIILLVSFISFIQPLYTITEPTDAAPVHSVSLPATDTKTVNVLPYVMQETAALPESRLTSEQVWQHVNNTLEENSNTILLLYLAGLLFFSARLLVQYLKSRWLKTKNTLPASDTWQTLLKQTKKQLNITANISIAFTKRNISPCIIGHAKAIILIPVAIANNLSTEQAESILLHELAHYKHYDHYINLATQCINCLMFFNPFVWLISKQCDKYRELACDATAKKHNRSIELAETLALIAGMYTRKNSMALSLKKQSPLLGRIQALLNVQPSAKTSQKPLSYILASIMLVTGILLVGSSDLFSKEHDNTREKLQRISKEMYEAGNEKYIFVDAVLDSIIKLPSKAEMLYMGPQYFAFESSQGPVKPEGSLKEKYLAKLQRFLVAQGETKYTVVEFKVGEGRKAFDIDHIYSEQFQQVSLRDHFDAGITSQAWAEIFNHFMDDNMPLYTNDDYELNYGPDGININGNQLTGEQEKKYRRLFREKFGIDLAKDKLSGRMNLYGLRSRHIEHNKAATPLQNEFAAISQILFNEGKIEYLVADAVKDGYLADGERFTLSFGDSIARFAGKRFSKQDEKAYDAKYKKFREYYVGRDCYGIITKTVHFTDIRNPRSDFMNGEFLFKERQQKRSKILSNIYKELRQDKLIDTNYRTEIDYRAKDGLFLNYEPFKASLTEKYMKMFRQIERDLDINSKTARFSYTWKIDKPFPQFYYDRMSSFITKDLLRNTSKTMYKDDDTKYIVADALADGILKEGERYDIAYKNGIVTIRNKTLTAEQQNEY